MILNLFDKFVVIIGWNFYKNISLYFFLVFFPLHAMGLVDYFHKENQMII
jgi:hypothetical protein